MRKTCIFTDECCLHMMGQALPLISVYDYEKSFKLTSV